MTDINNDELEALLGMSPEESPGPVKASPPPSGEEEADVDAFMSATGTKFERTVPDIIKPWMKHHEFILVGSIEELTKIVDNALAVGCCALDLETEGFDNRIFYTAEGKPYTKHKIVGFCLSYDGKTGYYAPVRHRPEDGGTNLNLPVEEAEAQIRRLCLASQPVGTPAAIEKDPLSPIELAEPPKVVLYFWNAKFDQEFLYPITGIDWWHPESFEDGLLVYFTHFSGDRALGLKDKSFQLLHDIEGNPHEMIKLKELFIQGRREIKFYLLSPDEPGCLRYACSDAICTFLLCAAPRLHEKKRRDVIKVISDSKGPYYFTYRLEKQTSQAVRWMERPRVRVNVERIRKLRDDNREKWDAIALKIKNLGEAKGFHNLDPSSTKQLGDFLFGEQGLNITPKPDKTTPANGEGQYKTDADTLERMAEENPNAPEALQWILAYRKCEKLEGTYFANMVDNVDANSEMRFNFKQTGAATGRFSAPAGEADQGFSGIPVHGIPAKSDMRKAFEAREGFTLVKSDYAGQELRIAANVSGEMVWIKEFLEGDGDLHTITARAFFPGYDQESKERQKELRKMGKIANFALVYGGGPASIMRATGCDKLEASRRKQAFDAAVPTFAKWIKSQHKFVRENKGIWTALNRWVAIPDIDSSERAIQAACERHSTNYPIQGTGADIMKIALVRLSKEFYKRKWLRQGGGDDSVRILLTVHDEIVFEIRNDRVQEAVALLVKVMVSPTGMAGPPHSPRWRVPLIVEPLIGLNWAGEYNYDMLMHGRPYKEGEKVDELSVVVGDRIYHKVPSWLEGKFIPGYQGGNSSPPAETSSVTPVAAVEAQAASPSPPPVSIAATPSAPLPGAKKTDVSMSAVTMRISILSQLTIVQVRAACAEAFDPDGKILRLVDSVGTTIIDPSLNIRISPERLAKKLKELHISDGAVLPFLAPSAALSS